MDESRSSNGSEPLSFETVTDGSIIDDIQQVKGLTFAMSRQHLIAKFGEEAWNGLMESLPLRTRALFEGVEFDDWYPEAELRRFMKAVHAQLAEGSNQRFVELSRELAKERLQKFFGMLWGLRSARFVIGKMPVIWRRLRRGPAEVWTERIEGGLVLVHYDNFRFCRDSVYRQMMIAECQAVVMAVDKDVPKVDVVNWDRYSMTISVRLA